MRPHGNDSLVLAALGLLAVTSLGLKAAAGPPHDGLMDIGAGRFETLASKTLERQHFSIARQSFPHRTTLIVATRGTCRLGVRDARAGAAMVTTFARDAAGIGTVRYLYRGQRYEEPPAFAMRLGRIRTEVLSRLGLSPQAPMPVALAASPGCGTADFGFGDVKV